MTAEDALCLAALNILKNPLRSALTVLGLAIGVGAVVTVLSLSEAGQKQVETEIARMGVNKIWITAGFHSNRLLKKGDGIAITAKTGFMACERAYQPTLCEAYGKSALAMVTGCDENMLSVHQAVVKQGRFINVADEKNMFDAAVLDENMVKALALDMPVGKNISVLGRYYTVVGVISNQTVGAMQSQGSIYIPISVFRACIADRTDEIAVSIQQHEDAYAAAKAAVAALPEEGEYDVLSLQEEIEAARAVVNIFTSVLAAVALICMAVGGIGVMNILLVSVNERRREIGVIKAVGGTDVQVLWLFLLEAASYGFLGAMLGIFAGRGMLEACKHSVGISAPMNTGTASLAAFAAMCIGLFFGAAPALKAARLMPVEALAQD